MSSSASRVWIDQRHAELAGQADLRDERAHLPSGRACRGSSPGRTRRSRRPWGAGPARRSTPGRPRREAVRVVGVDADRRVDLLELRRVSSTARSLDARPQPMVTMRSTPASSASSTRSPAGSSHEARWVWESTMALLLGFDARKERPGRRHRRASRPRRPTRRRQASAGRRRPAPAPRGRARTEPGMYGHSRIATIRKPLRQRHQHLIELTGTGRVLGEHPRRALLDELVEAPHELPRLLGRVGDVGAVERRGDRRRPARATSAASAASSPRPRGRHRRGSGRSC